MRILITNHWLKKLGGSETFTYTLAGELYDRGHDVHLFTNEPGMVSTRICGDFNIPRVSDPRTRKYDFVLANHNTCVKEVYPTKTHMVQTCHGTTPRLEQPSSLADAWVAISEEIRDHLAEMGFESDVIRNGINCDRFKPVQKLNAKPKTVLSLSHSQELNDKLKPIFESKGIHFGALNKFKNPVWNVEDFINAADMVISLGRGAYEAMACGRPVIVLDHRPYQEMIGDGLITEKNIYKLLYYNCSGRAYRNKDIAQIIDFALSNYKPSLGDWCREFALENLNIKHQVSKYINLYENV
jgi:glycosyltransferase involved in cell wall biosynthesis